MGRPTSTIVVLGDVGGGTFHIGDEAMMEANVELLRRGAPHASVTALGRPATRTEIAEALDGAHGALLSGGAGLTGGWPELAEQRLALLEEASRRSLPVVTGGQTLVPAPEGPARARLAELLAGVAHLGTRELPSTALAMEFGVAADRVVFQVDDAFTLAGRPPTDDALLAAAEKPYLAVTLDGSYAAPDMLPAVQALASQVAALAHEHDLGVVFLPHEGDLGERSGPDPAAGRLLARLLGLAGTRCHVAPVLPAAQAAWVSHGAALTVSSRYHPLVFATAAARPCIGLYRDAFTFAKIQGALAHVGAERWCFETRTAERGALLRAGRTLWADRAAVSARMAAAREGIDEREAERRSALLEHLGLQDSPARGNTATKIRCMPPATRMITDEQWDRFSRDGFLHLGEVLDREAVERLTQRADDLALGTVDNEHVQLQVDTGGAYEELPEAEAASTFEATRLYRKIQGLELDEVFAPLIRHPRFFEVCAHVYGPHVPLSIFRAMIMNKPAGQGTLLPWHQDGGDVWALDREPLLTIWVALDDATTANGCMEAVVGSHRLGLLSDYGSTLSDEHAAEHCPPERVTALEVPAGHAVLMHNWLIHRSGVNPSPMPRRAVTICYVDGRTRRILTGEHLPLVAGIVDAEPHHYVSELRRHADNLERTFARAEEYARSLATELEATRAEFAFANARLKNVEDERDALAAAAEHRRRSGWRLGARR